jgi:hypothetical protein
MRPTRAGASRATSWTSAPPVSLPTKSYARGSPGRAARWRDLLEAGHLDFQGMRLVLGGCCQGSAVGSGDRDRGLLGERRMGRPFYD